MTHARLDDPDLASLCGLFVLALLALKPHLPQVVVHRAAHDLHVWERALEHGDAAAPRDEEGHEDDVVLRDAVVEQYADGHERGGATADLLGGSAG